MDECIFCHQAVTKKESVVTLTAKGCLGIAHASKTRGDQINSEPGKKVHNQCRRDYCNTHTIAASRKRSLDTSSSTSVPCVLRSAKPSFNYNEHCVFCGNTDTYDHRRTVHGQRLVKVQTSEFHAEIDTLCDTRKDDWAKDVKGRLNNVNDLFAADTVYHQVCSVNFRTNKAIPRQFVTCEEDSQAKRGRPRDSAQIDAFLKVASYLQENDDEQTTINDLIEKLKEYLEDTDYGPYGFTYMKDQLKRFGDKIIITEISGKTNVVTLRSTASTILHDFYGQNREEDSSADKLRLIAAAAELLKNDIKSVSHTKDYYASCSALSSVEEAISFLPDSLILMLKTMFPSKDGQVKVASLGQAVMQATRPRTMLAPLQVGLGVQLHHHFASKFLIDV